MRLRIISLKKYIIRKRSSLITLRFKKLTKRLINAIAQQTKYYNRSYKVKTYIINNLIMLLIKNLKQKKFSKKLSHRFISSFRVKNKIKT